MSIMIVQTKCKLNNTELLLKLFHIQCKEIGNNKYYGEIRLNVDVRKEMEDPRLNTIECFKTDLIHSQRVD